jgi:tetratricopeptide (TPR) repeat protein
VAAAKGAFQAGNASFNEADYDRAITYWEDAYRRDCTAHLLLLNLARAYELNGARERAVTSLETYLARNPGSPDEAQIKRRIEKLREQLDEETDPQAGALPPVTPAEPADPNQPPLPDAAPEPPLMADSSRPRKSIVPLIVAGAGAVITVTGGVVFLVASGDLDDYDGQCPNRRCPLGQDSLAEDANSARTRQTVGGIVAGVGAAALAGGLIWYFLQKPSGSTTAKAVPTRFEPRVDRGFAGVSLSGAF